MPRATTEPSGCPLPDHRATPGALVGSTWTTLRCQSTCRTAHECPASTRTWAPAAAAPAGRAVRASLGTTPISTRPWRTLNMGGEVKTDRSSMK
jgi:hypothetical protein